MRSVIQQRLHLGAGLGAAGSKIDCPGIAACAFRLAALRQQAGVAGEWLACVVLVDQPIRREDGGQLRVGQHRTIRGKTEVRQRQRRFLADLYVRQVVVPDLFGLFALGEKQQIGFYARAGGGEHAAGQADDGPQVAFVHQLALGFDKGAFVGAEQQPLVQHDGAGAFRCQLAKDVLHEQHLGGAGFIGEVLLRILAFLAAKRRVGQDHVEGLGRLLEQRRVGGTSSQRVAMPQVGLVDAVQHQIGQRNREHQIFLFAAKEGVVLEGVDVGAGGALAQLAGNVLIGNGQKAAGTAAGVVHRLAQLRIDRMHHGADHLARGEELAAVGVLLAHFQQQVFIHLRQGEEVLVVDMVDVDLDAPCRGCRADWSRYLRALAPPPS